MKKRILTSLVAALAFGSMAFALEDAEVDVCKKAVFTAYSGLTSKNYIYTLVATDLTTPPSKLSTDYGKLYTLKKNAVMLTEEANPTDAQIKAALIDVAHFADDYVSIMMKMLDEMKNMDEAIEYINNEDHLYSAGSYSVKALSPIAKNDYAKIMQVKNDKANEDLTGWDYIFGSKGSFFTEAKINEIYTGAHDQFTTWDANDRINTLYNDYLKKYSNYTDKEYEPSSAEDYGENGGLRKAYEDYEFLINEWGKSGTKYRNIESLEACDIDPLDETPWTFGNTLYVRTGIKDKNTALEGILVDNLEKAAKLYVDDLLTGQMNDIMTNQYKAASDITPNDLKVTNVKKILNNLSKIGVNIYYWCWTDLNSNTKNAKIQECKTLVEAQTYLDAGTGLAEIMYPDEKNMWGYEQYLNFLANDAYKDNKKKIQAMLDAHDYLNNTNVQKILTASNVDYELFAAASNAENAYIALSPEAKEYLKSIKDDLYANIEAAKIDNIAINTNINIYTGNLYPTTLKYDAADVRFKSAKALKVELEKIPNSIAVIEADKKCKVLPTNVVYKKGGKYYADEIVLTHARSLYIPVEFEAKEISVTRKLSVAGRYYPMVLPFDVVIDENWDSDVAVKYIDMIIEQQDNEGKIVVKPNYNNKLQDQIAYAYMPYFLVSKTANKEITIKGKGTVKVTNNSINKDGLYFDATEATDKIDCTTTKTKYTIAGITVSGALLTPSQDDYVLKNGNWQCFLSGAIEIPAGSITLNIENRTGANYIIKQELDEEGETTGIEDVMIETSADDAIYTIDGIKVEKMNKAGIYIQNGKKVWVK